MATPTAITVNSAPAKPRWVDALLKRFGKSNSGLPLYRMIWGGDHWQVSFGAKALRYPEWKDRWLLEKMVLHDDYGPWNTEAFGPKPPDGEYELSQVIEVDGEFVDLETFGARTLELLILCLEKGKLQPRSEKLTAARARQEEADRKWRQKFSDIYDDSQRPFGEAAVSGIPDKKKPGDVKIYTPDDLSPKLRRQLTRPGNIRQLN